jgi:hypothetical protein
MLVVDKDNHLYIYDFRTFDLIKHINCSIYFKHKIKFISICPYSGDFILASYYKVILMSINGVLITKMSKFRAKINKCFITSINNSDLTEDNFDKSTINKTSINKSTIPNVGFNDFLKKMKPINNENESNNCKKVIVSSINKMKNNNNYLSPKITSSQVFNNYYSFNNVETTHIPVKVINIYKK